MVHHKKERHRWTELPISIKEVVSIFYKIFKIEMGGRAD